METTQSPYYVTLRVAEPTTLTLCRPRGWKKAAAKVTLTDWWQLEFLTPPCGTRPMKSLIHGEAEAQRELQGIVDAWAAKGVTVAVRY